MADVIGNNLATTATVASAASSALLPGQLPPPPYGHLSSGPSSVALTRPLSQPTMATSRTPLFPPHHNAQEHQQLQAGQPVPAGVRPPPLNIATAFHPDGDIDTTPTPASLASSRKRAAPIEIDVENANQNHPGVYAPDTSRPLAGEAAAGGLSELICLCTKAPKVPRPRNAFILYRQHYQSSVAAEHPGLANPEISKLIGEKWREQPEELKNRWKRLAEEEKARHQRQYPDYRYQPRRGGKNAQPGGNNHKPVSGGGEDPGRCAKCGGRYIATARTPSTPFVAAPPPLVPQGPRDVGGMPSYMTQNPRVIETDHMMRRGSSASIMSMDSHGRRYTTGPVSMREMDEDYALMSAQSPTHAETVAAKRRRVNGSGVYLPGSPPATYTPHPGLDPRYYYHPQRAQQGRQLSLGTTGTAPPPQISAGGRGNTGRPLPRPSSGAGGAITQLLYRTSISGMQPPPRRPSIPYQASEATQVRTGGGFDESLRLPPLQTQGSSPPSPPPAGEYGGRVGGAQSGTPTGPGTVPNGPLSSQHPLAARHQQLTQHMQQEQQHAQSHQLPTPPPRYQFMLKLEMLRAISPPLKAASPGSSSSETRGPLIAVEGEPGVAPQLLKATAAVVETALRISDECVVKVWHGNAAEDAAPKTAGEDGGGPKGKGHASPLAEYVAEMLQWHHTSEELVKYMTTAPLSAGGEQAGATLQTPRRKIPVAVMGSGYSLTQSNHFASALRVADAYRPDDHWRWVATLWRGIVGPDLTIYVKLCPAVEIWTSQGDKSVEFANPGIMVLRVPATDPASLGSSRAVSIGAGSGPAPVEYTPHVDEKLERRLGFEIMEWLRSHASPTVGNRGG